MAKNNFFQAEFDRLATNGVIGDPDGLPAYCYLRVSDDSQSDEGRSGLPRQIEHIHEIAKEKGYRISRDRVFADDHTGFEFEFRPELSKLRREYKKKRASAVVMEHLDRLSRDSDWHQGFLLDEMEKHGIQPVFWKEYGSRVERAVMGAIAQDGMEQAKERMAEGTRRKARDGRITAKRAALGYRFVDRNGNEGTTEARKDTFYAIDPDRAVCIEFIYQSIAYGGMTCFQLLTALDEKAKTDSRYAPPTAKAWNERSLVKLIRNPLYKGEYIANRFYKTHDTETDDRGESKQIWREHERPEHEWIRVDVPAIVDSETWETANRNLYRNKGFARRNKKNDYLLTAMIRCASCGHAFHGHTDTRGVRRYYDSVMFYTAGYRENHPCDQEKRSLHCDVLDTAVWQVITEALLDPDHILQAIAAQYNNDYVQSVRQQISFLERELAERDNEQGKLYRAYLASAFDEYEFANEKKRVARECDTLSAEIEQLKAQIMTPEEIEAKKKQTYLMVEQAQQVVNVQDAPFSLKQKIVRLLIDEITLNLNEEWFEIRGTIGAGVYSIVGMSDL